MPVNSVNLQELLMAEQGAQLAQMARASMQQIDFQAKIFTRLEASADPVEAASIKEIGKSGMSVDLASIRPPALPAVTP